MSNINASGVVRTKHKLPILLDATFVVNSTDTAGLGVTNIKAPGFLNIFMATSATPGQGTPFSLNGASVASIVNPNPVAGIIYVQLATSFVKVLSCTADLRPVLDTAIAVDASDALLTVGTPYEIVTVGTSTADDWTTLGVPPGVTPAVGVQFLAAATGAGTGNGTVSPYKVTTAALSVNMLGTPVQPNGTARVAQGQIILLQSVNASARAAIPDGTTVHLKVWINDSTVPSGTLGAA